MLSPRSTLLSAPGLALTFVLALLCSWVPAAAQDAKAPAPAAAPAGKFVPVKPDATNKVYKLERKDDRNPVIDGDTLRLAGLDSTVRLLGVDAEEIYHNDHDEDAAHADFDKYAKDKRGTHPRPVKYGTPEGVAGASFGTAFFEGVDSVLLQVDDPLQTIDYYGRYLGYILVDRDGDGLFEQNYDLELVRAGHSPYFVKYGRLRRYDADFAAAQEEARRAGRGIWAKDAPGKEGAGKEGAGTVQHYSDYPERLVWWTERADAIDTYAAKHASDPAYFRLGLDSEFMRLKGQIGKRVTIFCSVGVPERPVKAPHVRAFASHRNQADVPVLCRDDAIWEKLRPTVLQCDGDLVYITGIVHAGERDGTLALELDSDTRIWREPAGEPAAPPGGDAGAAPKPAAPPAAPPAPPAPPGK